MMIKEPLIGFFFICVGGGGLGEMESLNMGGLRDFGIGL